MGWRLSLLKVINMYNSELLCDLYDIRNMARLHGFGKLPKDNDGSDLTINDLLDNAIQQLEEV